MDAFYLYTYSSAVWLTVQAAPLFVSPKVIIALLAEDGHRASDVEVYLSRSLALALFTLAFLLIFLSGSVPFMDDVVGGAAAPEKSPYAVPLVLSSTFLHTAGAIYTYTRYAWTEQAIYAVAAIAWVSLASLGFWCVAFGTGKGHISKKTGADKRVSGFPFRNVESDKKKGRVHEE